MAGILHPLQTRIRENRLVQKIARRQTGAPAAGSDQFSAGADKPPAGKPYYVNHTHWDREWYRLHAAYQIRLGEAMDDILKRMKTGELQKFSLDGQISALEDYFELLNHTLTRGSHGERKAAADKIELTKSLIKAGRIEVGPWFVQPDLFLTSGESLVRNLKKGIDSAKRLGSHNFVGYLPDPFGQPADMPLIFNGVGIDNIILWRGANPDKSEFYWQSRDGSTSLVRWYPWNGYSFRELHIARQEEAVKIAKMRKFMNTVAAKTLTGNVLFPLGGDHLGATPTEGLKLMRREFPQAKEVTFSEFMAALKKDVQKLEKSGTRLAVQKGHLLDNTDANILQGVYSARLYLKQENRRLEHALTKVAEPLTAFSQLMLPDAQAPRLPRRELEKAWTQLLYNQPHDSICGCSVDEVHLENETRFNTAKELTQDVIRKQNAAIGAAMAGQDEWVVFNNSSRPYTGVVKVREWAYLDTSADYSDDVKFDVTMAPATRLPQKTKETLAMEDQYLLDIYDNPRNHVKMMQREGLIWVENVPPFGAKVVSQKASQPEFTPVELTGERSAGNGLISMRIENSGQITVTDQKTGQVYKGLHLLSDQADNGDSYNAAPVPGAPKHLAKLTGTRVIENGPLRTVFELSYQMNGFNTSLTTRVTMEAGSPQLQFESSYTNLSPQHKLQVGFPTEEDIHEVRAEGHFGIEARQFDPYYNETKLMPADKTKIRELPTNTGAIQRFVMANRQMITTEGLTEYEVSGRTLNITLLRAFGQLSDKTMGVRDDEAGPPFETPGGQMINRPMTVRYAWQPQPKTDAEAYQWADRFYGTVYGEQGRKTEGAETDKRAEGPSTEASAKSQSMIAWDNPHVVSSTVKLADNGKGLLVRLINTSDQPQSVTFKPGFAIKGIRQVNFLEEVQAKVKQNTLTLKPYEATSVILKPKH